MTEPAEHEEEGRMSLGEHLEELRYRLMMGMAGPVVAMIGLCFVAWDMVSFLCRPLLVRLKAEGLPTTLYNPTVGSAFGVYMKVALIGGLIVGLPWLVYQLWKFVAPGLMKNERKFVVSLVPGSVVLTTLGVVFMYYVMLPITLWFMISFSSTFPMPDLTRNTLENLVTDAAQTAEDKAWWEHVQKIAGEQGLPKIPILVNDPPSPDQLSDGSAWIKAPEMDLKIVVGGRVFEAALRKAQMMSPLIHVDQYLSFVMWLALGFAVAFQLPLILMVLAWSGIVSYRKMAGVRKFAILACAVVGALLTPADVFSQMTLAIPLYILYEFGLFLMWWIEGRKAKAA